jgi:hypothetical protein
MKVAASERAIELARAKESGDAEHTTSAAYFNSNVLPRYPFMRMGAASPANDTTGVRSGPKVETGQIEMSIDASPDSGVTSAESFEQLNGGSEHFDELAVSRCFSFATASSRWASDTAPVHVARSTNF